MDRNKTTLVTIYGALRAARGAIGVAATDASATTDRAYAPRIGDIVSVDYRDAHRGVVVAVDDPRAWANTLAFPDDCPDPDAVRAHVARHPSLLDGKHTPVLWTTFGPGRNRVYWEPTRALGAAMMKNLHVGDRVVIRGTSRRDDGFDVGTVTAVRVHNVRVWWTLADEKYDEDPDNLDLATAPDLWRITELQGAL